ncbi:hypothetical protein [Polynucleobacter necessarius]|uniref:hypothetical protein n=1 Tax=Polynucleobacter necessarius TaxID=576610 RepID=UPI001E42B984|nr:hypothetical protein [Polynucleobacter necessarius]
MYRLLELIKNKIIFFWLLHMSIIQKNTKWKGLHSGETCLIFGNGASLRYYNIADITKMPSIGCTFSLVDNRMVKFGLDYCVVPEPYFFYPVRRDSRSDAIVRNYIGKIMMKIIKRNKKSRFFCSITNYYAFMHRFGNVSYWYHGGAKSSESFDLSGKFGRCTGALDMMLGVAQYMGFSKAILIGCDYLGNPVMGGHFYADDIPKYENADITYANRIKGVAADLDILVLLPKGSKSSLFKSMSFEEYFNTQEKYHENFEIVDDQYLSMMRIAASKIQIVM